MSSLLRNRQAKKRNLLSLLITAVIILALVIAGPVQAVNIKVKTDKAVYDISEGKIVFTTSIDIQRNERIPIKTLKLIIRDQKENVIRECEFLPDGSASCTNIIVIPINTGEGSEGAREAKGFGFEEEGDEPKRQETDFGFGYGYQDEVKKSGLKGELLYEIEWNFAADGVEGGKYFATLEAYAEDSTEKFTYTLRTPKPFNIKPKMKSKVIGRAQVEAKEGEIVFLEELTDFDKEKATFNTNIRRTTKDGDEGVDGVTSLEVNGETPDGIKVTLELNMRSKNHKTIQSFTEDKIEVTGNADINYQRRKNGEWINGKRVGYEPTVSYRKTLENVHFLIENNEVLMWDDGNLFKVELEITKFNYK